jgi:hypothetical protein
VWLGGRWRLPLAAFFVWTLLGLLQTAQLYLSGGETEAGLTAARSLGFGFGLMYSWGLLWMLAFPLALRFPLGPHQWRSQLALHAVAGVLFAAAKIFLDYPVIKLFYCPTPETLTLPLFLKDAFAGYFFRYVLFYWAMIGVAHALAYYGKYRQGELRAAQLEMRMTEARLQLLKTQLQPHFLFNTLNAISALLHTDVEAADRMLARLGELLRLALEDFGVQEAPLARELDIVHSYLDIEQARLGPRLQVAWDIAPDTTDALVPTFLLQPLVENAIHHGIAPRTGPGRVEVRARRSRDALVLEVRDNGLGFSAVPSAGGVGLANTRARLLHLYGAAQRLEVGNGPHGGGLVHITLPFREQGEVPADGETKSHDPNDDCG